MVAVYMELVFTELVKWLQRPALTQRQAIPAVVAVLPQVLLALPISQLALMSRQSATLTFFRLIARKTQQFSTSLRSAVLAFTAWSLALRKATNALVASPLKVNTLTKGCRH